MMQINRIYTKREDMCAVGQEIPFLYIISAVLSPNAAFSSKVLRSGTWLNFAIQTLHRNPRARSNPITTSSIVSTEPQPSLNNASVEQKLSLLST